MSVKTISEMTSHRTAAGIYIRRRRISIPYPTNCPADCRSTVTLTPLFRRISGAIPIVMGSESQLGRNKMEGRVGRQSSLLPDPDRVPGFLLQLPNGREGWLVARRVRVARRALAVLAWTIPAMSIQAL